jgi:hypothetical protein
VSEYINGSGVFLQGALNVPLGTANTSSLSFANQTTGTTSAQQTLTVTNSGAPPFVISGVTIDGAAPGDFVVSPDSCSRGAKVAGGGNCKLEVAFSPSDSGSRSATLHIAAEPPGSPIDVALSGTGVAPPSPVDEAPQDQPTPPTGPAATPPASQAPRCVVPRLKGKRLAAAKRSLRAAHCVPAKVIKQRAPRSLRNRVVKTRPSAGARLPNGSKVVLIVGR